MLQVEANGYVVLTILAARFVKTCARDSQHFKLAANGDDI